MTNKIMEQNNPKINLSQPVYQQPQKNNLGIIITVIITFLITLILTSGVWFYFYNSNKWHQESKTAKNLYDVCSQELGSLTQSPAPFCPNWFLDIKPYKILVQENKENPNAADLYVIDKNTSKVEFIKTIIDSANLNTDDIYKWQYLNGAVYLTAWRQEGEYTRGELLRYETGKEEKIIYLAESPSVRFMISPANNYIQITDESYVIGSTTSFTNQPYMIFINPQGEKIKKFAAKQFQDLAEKGIPKNEVGGYDQDELIPNTWSKDGSTFYVSLTRGYGYYGASAHFKIKTSDWSVEKVDFIPNESN